MKRTIRGISIFSLLCALSWPANSQLQFPAESVLASGTWHRIAVAEAGVYKIDHAFITGQLGLSPASVDARQIRIYGNRGGALPQKIDSNLTTDLQEIHAWRSGLDDGTFNQGDFILFYAEGPDRWYLNDNDRYFMVRNIYDQRNHYFIRIGGGNAATIATEPSLPQADLEVSTSDERVRREIDRVNLLGKFQPPGSGKRWFGDEFSATREKTYTLEVPDVVTGSEVRLEVDFAGRSGVPSNVYADAGGQVFSQFISHVNLGNVEDDYARIGRISGAYLAAGDAQSITIRYPAVAGSTSSGWLDFIQVEAPRQLIFRAPSVTFRNIESQYHTSARYTISNAGAGTVVWDITDPLTPVQRLTGSGGNTISFAALTGARVREYLAFNPNGNFARPEYVDQVPNQNLHGITGADLVIIYHPDFEEAAMRLAEHRRTHSGYRVQAVPIQQVYNEFSGGSVDATAIRNLAVMLKNRDPEFRFLLLFGDGTYDMRHLNQDIENDNYIPVYETNESLDPIRSFPSDDYFALLNAGEGETLLGAIDIAVGRLPVGSAAEADAVVSKIIDYDINPASLGDWRMRLVWVADDEDNNLHLNQSEDISTDVESNYGLLNLNRIYLDAFQQMSTPGGARYPDVNAAINNNMFKGALAINYLGHGGHLGWSQERILGIADIQSWTNYNRLPLFVTATCSFTGYDEPTYQSAGEQVLLNPGGGAVALLTTVRPVYASSNKRLTEAVFEQLFEKVDGTYLPLGEVMRLAKNSNAQDTININARKFAIIGDPSMHLALPEHAVAVTEVNGNPVGGGPDTARALEQVTLKGEVRDQQGTKLTAFNGEALITVYDKPVTVRTLANDPKSFEREFRNLSRIIFKGSATVTNGSFTTQFVVPGDIDFNYGRGKVSIYATDKVAIDAGGSYQDLVIGGTSLNPDVDNEGPDIRIFLNNESFVSGGKTGPDPTLLLKLSDASGINVIGNSIGHDLVAVLDGDSRKSYILNEFYVATIDDFTSGTVRFPLSDLEPGPHTITVTAWDVAGNFSEASIDFVVTENPGQVIRNVRNYPNPFTESTEFAFDHDLPAGPMDAAIDIYDTWGRLVNSIQQENVISIDGQVTGLEWNTRDPEKRQYESGIYVYQVRLVANPGTSQRTEHKSAFGKLILIN